MNPVFGGDGASKLTCGLVRVTPGARTNWHSHANGQLLVCTDGIGLVGTRDGETVVLRAGESVWTAAGEEHFHGGTGENMMCHYAILDASGEGEATSWLDSHTQVMVQLAAILAAGGQAEFRVITGAGVELPLPGQSASTPATRLEHGKAVQGRVVGDDEVAARLTNTPPDEVHFQRYLAANCFGDTVGRGGIDLAVRELLTFSMLVALDGADAQVRGHVNGNLKVGSTREKLLAVLTVLVPFIGYPRTLNGLAALNDITR